MLNREDVSHAVVTPLIDMSQVPNDGWIIPVAMMGSPTATVGEIPSGRGVFTAFQMLERSLACRAFATIPLEAGGVNSLLPMVVGASLDIAVVDADCMGRAFPEIQMITPSMYRISTTPMAVADEKGNCVLLQTVEKSSAERISRAVVVQMGGCASIALCAMPILKAREALIEGSLSLQCNVGRIMRDCARKNTDATSALLALLKARLLCEGKITAVQRWTDRGFTRGDIEITGTGRWSENQFSISFKNENLVFFRDRKALVMVPDIITLLEQGTGLPVNTEALRHGLQVAVIGVPCNAKWRSPAGLALVGPRSCGYHVEYVPLEAAPF